MCMTHVPMHKLCKRYRDVSMCFSGSMVLAVLLSFFKTQVLSNRLVNMSLLASNKLERTD